MMWRVISDEVLHLRSWGDECIVYNSLSGDTHLIGAVAAHALSILQKAPSEAAILAEALAPMLQTACDEDLVSDIEHLLSDLARLELIERS